MTRELTSEEKAYIARQTDNSAEKAWASMMGHASQRMAAENKAKDLGIEIEPGGSFKPGPETWREMDEFDGSASFRPTEDTILEMEVAHEIVEVVDGDVIVTEKPPELNARQVHINRRVEDSKRLGAFVRDALKNVTTMEQVYALSRMVEAFDAGTEKRGMELKPLWEFVSMTFDAAEHRIREAEEILEHMQDNPRTMAQTTNCLVLALIEHGHVSTNLATSHIDDERWIRMQEALHAGRYHIGPNKWGQQTLFMEAA